MQSVYMSCEQHLIFGLVITLFNGTREISIGCMSIDYMVNITFASIKLFSTVFTLKTPRFILFNIKVI